MKNKQDFKVHYELLKAIAEYNRERMFQYDVEKDVAVHFAVKNGEFTEDVVFENYRTNLDKYLAELSEEDREAFKTAIDKCTESSCQQVLDIHMNTSERKEWFRLFLASIADNPDQPDEITTVAGRFMSIQDQKEVEESIRRKAEIDALTGVYNHATFENLCEKVLKEEKSDIMFLMIDVDDFKMINDTLGHNVGDMVLSQTGEILKHNVQNRGYAGRLGGDEFAIIVWGFDDRTEIDDFCNQLTNDLKNIIFDMEYSASMGVAVRGDRFMTFKDLYYEADQAVYSAKKNGKNQLVFYEDVLVEKKSACKINADENIDFDDSGIDEFDKAVMNNNPEYIIVTCLDERKILFMNRAAKKASVMDDYTLSLFIKTPLDEDYVEIKECRRDLGERHIASIAAERSNSFLGKLFGNANLLLHIEFGKIDDRNIERVSIINISDKTHINQVQRLKQKSQKTINELFNYVTTGYKEDSEYRACAKTLLNYYGADCAIITYQDENGKLHFVQQHKSSAETTAKLVEMGVSSLPVTDLTSIYNEDGSVFVDDIKTFKKSNSVLYKKLADLRIWSFEGNLIKIGNDVAGAVLVLNPRENACDRKLIEMITSFIGSQISFKKMENIFEYGESHDKVTGLLRREKFKKWDAGSTDLMLDSLGLFITDIVSLKKVNSTFGYATGNNRLKTVADTLRDVFSGNFLYRFDDDEFLAFCPDIGQNEFENLVSEMNAKLKALDFAVAGGFSWRENVNIGKQIVEAEEVMNIDKERLRQESVPLFKQAKKVIMDVENDLNQGKFTVFLQPKVNMNTGKTVGAEALVRLFSDEFGVIGPLKFIPLLEEHNAVHMIDLFVLDNVCKFQYENVKAGKAIIPISVNFSKKTLIHPSLIDAVREIMERYSTPKGYVQIEITETISDMDHLIISNIANSLRKMGFELAMDDFGTKYANMETLVNFQFGVAKIDRSLVKDITTNEKSVVMLRHLTAMLKELDIECVIEGVETQDQIDILRNMNCEVIQGFFYGKPTPCKDFYSMFME